MSEATKTKQVLFIASLAVVAFMAATAQGDILGFIPEPASPGMPEFVWDGSTLTEGAGSLGTGYMTAGPGDIAAAPGLTMNVPYLIPNIPGGVAGTVSTAFCDATLDILTALPADGFASLSQGDTVVVQPLGTGQFALYSTDPAAGGIEDDYVLLLSGTINSAAITGPLGTTTGAVLSADVTYTGGAVVDAISGGTPFDGGFSWTLLDMNTPLAVSGQPDELMLDAFQANATGHFTPEPGTIALLSIGGLLVAMRRRRNRV